MSVAYQNSKAVAAIASGSDTEVELEVPYRGVLNRLIIKQTSGTIAGFTFDVYSRTLTGAPLDTDLYRVQSQQTPAGASSEQYGLNLGYVNQDDQDADTLRPTGRLIVVINPGGSGNKDFEFSWTTTSGSLT